MAALRWAALALLAGLAVSNGVRAEDGTVLRVPAVPEWKLLYKVAPAYPTVALQRHIQGVVRFTALIGKDGRVERLSLVSGHPLLVSAARQAAWQWVYRPMILRGRPVRVVTQIEVKFSLDLHGRPLNDDRLVANRSTAW